MGLPVVFRRLELVLAVTLAVADQIAKALLVRALPLHESVVVIPGLLNFTHVRNTGAAFGLFNALDFPYKSVVITLVAVVALVAIAFYAERFGANSRLSRVGLGLVLGGALGNLVDRARLGYVVDFVDAYWGSWHFWAFNVADAAITVGATALVLDMLLTARHVPTAR